MTACARSQSSRTVHELLFRIAGGLMSTPSHLAALRHHGNYAKPAPPMRKNVSAAGGLAGAASAGPAHLDSSFPPPPPPISGAGDPELTGSNSTTPRGSMEHLPPPPPHLLHSDEDEPHQPRDASPQVTRQFHELRVIFHVVEFLRTLIETSPFSLPGSKFCSTSQ